MHFQLNSNPKRQRGSARTGEEQALRLNSNPKRQRGSARTGEEQALRLDSNPKRQRGSARTGEEQARTCFRAGRTLAKIQLHILQFLQYRDAARAALADASGYDFN